MRFTAKAQKATMILCRCSTARLISPLDFCAQSSWISLARASASMKHEKLKKIAPQALPQVKKPQN
jgi:hypothetical protein